MSILAGLSIYCSLPYVIINQKMVREYVWLVSRHMSKKEKVSRYKTIRENCLKGDLTKGDPFPVKTALKNSFVFFFRKRIPKSNFPKYSK